MGAKSKKKKKVTKSDGEEYMPTVARRALPPATGADVPATTDGKKPAKKGEEEDFAKPRFRRRAKTAEAMEGMGITKIVELKDPGWEQVQFYPVHPPYSYVRIKVYTKTREYVYEAIEPELDGKEKKLYKFLVDAIIDTVDFYKDDIEEKDEQARRLKLLIKEILISNGYKLEPASIERLFYYCYRKFLGYDLITIMMEDGQLEDVSCDGTGVPIYVFHREFKNIKTSVVWYDSDELDQFAINLAQRSNKSISIAHPVLDATLPDGSRLNETFGYIVTTRGTSFTIRKFKEDPLTMANLVGWRTLSKEMAAHLWLAVQYGESMLISGGTASGKTTTLNAISHFIPPSAKVITIEDTREMNLPHENWVAGLTREKKSEGEAGMNIDMYALLVAALRQRPEYMLVGEVRGKETMAVFQAMATGQITYATIHADSVASIIHRLENPPINIPRILILGLNLVLLQAQVKVKNRRTRRIKELAEIIGIEPTTSEIVANSIYKWIPARDEFRYSGHSKLYEKIMDLENMTAEEVMVELKQRQDVIEWMVQTKGKWEDEVKRGEREKDWGHVQLATLVNEYYRDSGPVVERIRRELEEYASAEVQI